MSNASASGAFEISKPEDEWARLLTVEQYGVLRQGGTERPGTSSLNGQYGSGIYVCAACASPVFSSNVKYDSKSGWPSFWDAIPGALGTTDEQKEAEVHCGKCGGHLGHVLPDGPPPTGLRYCINGVALRFIPA